MPLFSLLRRYLPRSSSRNDPLRRSFLTGSLLLVGGCTLMDQRTFNPNASRPPHPYIPPAPPPKPPVPPLIEIIAGTPESEWKTPLERSVRKALALKPDILFRVQALLPPGASPDAEAAALAKLTSEDGKNVISAIIGSGAKPAQVEIAAMTLSGLATPRIRVYVH